MIYQVVWNAMANIHLNKWGGAVYFPRQADSSEYDGATIDGRESFADLIKKSTDDTFTLVLGEKVKTQEAFEKFLKDFNLEEYLVYRQPYGFTNVVHPDQPRNLRLYILQSPNHFQRKVCV